MTDHIRITIAVPETMIDDANQLARVLGYSAADDQTYGPARHLDAEGHRYSVASGLVSAAFPAAAASPLTEPDWGADMAAAARAQALIRLHSEDDPVTAGPGHIAAIIHDDPEAALAMLGLSYVEGGP